MKERKRGTKMEEMKEQKRRKTDKDGEKEKERHREREREHGGQIGQNRWRVVRSPSTKIYLHM